MANIIRRENNEVARSSGQDYRVDPFRMMDALFRWDPFRGDGNSLFSGGGDFTPRFDVKETKGAFVIKADLPGVNDEDVNVSVTGHQLTISGHREHEHRDEGEQFFAIERSSGSFTRSFSLPDVVDAEAVKADLKGGVLTVEIPKRPEAQPRRITVGRGAGTPNSGGGKA
jgi:HSP20 family protein